MNYSAKNYTDIKHGSTTSSTTSITSKNIPLSTAIFNKFIQELENLFTFSNYVSDVLTSSTFSAVTILSISKTDKSSFDIIGGALYACSPIYGVVVLLLFINSNYQARQKYWIFITGRVAKIYVDHSHFNSYFCVIYRQLFYQKLKFHPAHSSCYSFEHTFPSTIINAINDLDSSEYLLERNKIQYETNIKYKPKIEYPCEICG